MTTLPTTQQIQQTLNQLPLSYSFIPAVNKGMTNGSSWMLLLHGRGDSKSSYEILAKEINVTGVNFLALNAPFAMDMGGFMEGYSWYDMHKDANEPAYRKSIELLLQSITLLKELGVGAEDLFILGFSQGGRMALDILHHLDRPIAGAIALSPRMSPFISFENTPPAVAQTPLYIAHGNSDPMIPYSETKAEVERWQHHCQQLTFKTYDFGHEIDIMEIIELRDWLNELI